MDRRNVLRSLGASLGSLIMIPSASAAHNNGAQPFDGELPNENVPSQEVSAFPETEETIEVGQFIQMRTGWVGPDIEHLLDIIHQTIVFDGETFVLDSSDDWDISDDEAEFTHTHSPKPNGKTFEVTMDVVYTEEHTLWEDSPDLDEVHLEPGDRHPGSPWTSTYEVVSKNRGK